MHRLDLGLYSHPKEFWGLESKTMLTPRGKSPLQEGGSDEVRTRNPASDRTASPTQRLKNEHSGDFSDRLLAL